MGNWLARAVWNFRSRCAWVILFVLFLCLDQFQPGQAQSTIVFGPMRVTNNFPSGIIFEVDVTNPGLEIQSAEFVFYVPSILRSGLERGQVVFRSGEYINLQFSIPGDHIPPGTQIQFHWEVMSTDGKIYRSKEEQIRYDDASFEWDHFEQDKLTLFCHDRKIEDCQKIFEIATQTISQQTVFYHNDYQLPFTIWIYNEPAEIKRWYPDLPDNFGGQTFNEISSIVICVPVDDTQEKWDWVRNVIPHEISHLFFHWNTANGYVHAPIWLNEGNAVNSQITGKEEYVRIFNQMVDEKTIIPLGQLEEYFSSGDPHKNMQAYAESYNLIYYMVTMYGTEAYFHLLDAYKHSKAGDYAFYDAFGCTEEDFEKGWLKWLEAPEQAKVEATQGILYGTPTLTRTETVMPSQMPTALATLKGMTVTTTPTPREKLQFIRQPLVYVSMAITGACLLLGVVGFGVIGVILSIRHRQNNK